MFPRISPTTTKAWKELQAHYTNEMKQTQMRKLFASDPDRFDKYSLQFGDILFDYSKNIITDTTLVLLQQLAAECQLPEAIKAMYSGEKNKRNRKSQCFAHRFKKFIWQPPF